MMSWTRWPSVCAVVVVVLGLISVESCRADVTYLALGDSLTFGLDPSTPASLVPSYADQGFVRPLADMLGTHPGGVRPNVLNLAISGELSSSFFTGSPPPGWALRAPELNANYANTAISQNQMMVSSINAIHAAGHSVGYVSLLFGSNDIFYLAGNPAFQGADPLTQLGMLSAVIGNTFLNYEIVLSEIKMLAPEARILLPGYYNPFPSFAAEHGFYDQILGIFNPGVQAYAQAFGAHYVDLYTPFVGRELELTNIGIGDVHANQAGYAVIAKSMGLAVPEPASMVSLAVGLSAIVGYRKRRQAATRFNV